MRVVYLIVGIYAAVAAGALVRIGIPAWRETGRPLSHWLRGGPFSAAFLSALDRTCLVGGAGHGFFAVAVLAALAQGNPASQERAGIAIWVMAAGMFGTIVSGFLVLSISWFNRPRFLVPPRLRADVGLGAARGR